MGFQSKGLLNLFIYHLQYGFLQRKAGRQIGHNARLLCNLTKMVKPEFFWNELSLRDKNYGESL